MNRVPLRSVLLLCVAAVVLAAAGAAHAATYVPLNISGGFNMNCMVGPVVASQANLNLYPLEGVVAGDISAWEGTEASGFARWLASDWNFGTGNGQFVCDSSSNDGLAGNTYKYMIPIYQGTGSSAITGSQGLPENGIITSVVDSRSYLIASVSGNTLLPGDWTEPAYNSGLNGTTIFGSVIYGPGTYTASNNKLNAIVVGEARNAGTVYWRQPFVMASFQPGYYSDINFLLVGECHNTIGCSGTQIWATYANVVNGSNSILIYGWSTATTSTMPVMSMSTATADFALAYMTKYNDCKFGAVGQNELRGAGTNNTCLWEFTTPKSIDPARVLVSITISNVLAAGTAAGEIAVFGSTATASASASNTLTVNQTTGGNVTTSQSGITTILTGYPYGAQVAVTATATGGYSFSSWSVVPAANGSIAGSGSQAVLTIYGSVTVSANFSAGGSNYTLALNVGPQGTAAVTPSQASYTYGQPVTITMSTITAGNVLDHWVLNGTGLLTNSGALTCTLQVQGQDTISAVYTSGSYVNNLSPNASDTGVGSLAQPFKTISKALTKVRAAQAQSIVIQQGVYHEAPCGTVTGSVGNFITVRSNPGDRAVVNGADVIPQGTNSWTLCDSTTASGNTNFAHIYYTDVTWSGCVISGDTNPGPFRLSEDEQLLVMAQTPSNGPPCYWSITGTAGAGTLIDTAHLTQADSSYWLGSRIFYYTPYNAFGIQYNTPLTISAYDPATSKLSFSPTNMVLNTNANYFLFGSPKLLNGSGQYAVEALSGSTHQFRVWVWPAGNGRPDGHQYQASRFGNSFQHGLLDFTLWTGNPGYYIVDGLETCYGTGNGIGVRGTASGNVFLGGGNNIVRNCVTHDNDWAGLLGAYNLNGLYTHNLACNNGLWYGHQTGGEGGCGFNSTGWPFISMNETYLENESGGNLCDGFYMASTSLNIVGNYIHNNGQWGHCDGIQLCMGVGAIYGNSSTIANNLVVGNGDFMQANSSSNLVLENNVCLCTLGWGFQAGCVGVIWDHNTIVGLGALAGYTDGPLTITNNLFATGDLFGFWPVDTTLPYYSDSNLVYLAPGISVSNCQLCYSSTFMNWNNYKITSGMDAHTITDSLPLMNAAPAFVLKGLSPDLGAYGPGYSASTVYIPYSTFWELNNTLTGDNIEINGDGVLRQVTNVSNSIITFTPSSAARLLDVYQFNIINWKTQTCTTRSMDVMLQAGSPAKGKGSGGTDIGALNFKVADYAVGKLNGASKRVLPLWPPAPVTLAAAGWSYLSGATAHALTEGGTYTSPNMTGFQLTFGGAPLYALSCTNTAAVTVVDNTGTTYPVSTATLDSTGTVLTITLTNALPGTKTWLQVNVGPALMGANGTDPTVGTNGGPVVGVKSMRFTIN